MKLVFSRQTFEKFSNINFHDSQSIGNRSVPRGRTDRQTDRHDKAASRFSECLRAHLKTGISGIWIIGREDLLGRIEV